MTNLTKRTGGTSPTIIEKELSYTIVGAAMEVYNELGYGFGEPIYSRALQAVLVQRGLVVVREFAVEVLFRGAVVGTYRLDMLVEGRVILEIKSTERMAEVAHRQLRSYLSATKLELGLILHFGPRFASHRVLGPWRISSTRERSSNSSDSSDSDARL